MTCPTAPRPPHGAPVPAREATRTAARRAEVAS